MNLDQLRDELAEKYAFDICEIHGEAEVNEMYAESKPFCDGWNAAIKLLSESAGEFDVSAACDEFEERWEHVDRANDACEGARWQFERDAARIGLAERKVSELEQRLSLADEGFKTVLEENATIKQLEALLAESPPVAKNPSDSQCSTTRED